MRVREIEAKVMLSTVRQPDDWFGLKYNLNLYRGCMHRCIYCDSRSECYGIEDFDGEILVKTNAIELLERELARKRVRGTIGTGSMNDPYMPLEKQIELTRRALQVIARFRFPVHILTKSDLVLRDLDLLQAISQSYAAVSFTLTTADDALAAQIEPNAPPPSARLAAMRALSAAGLYTGVLLMPVLPFIEDTRENLAGVLQGAAAAGARYVIPALGMTLRDRQRDYYYAQLDRHFPGLSDRYRQAFGERYSCPAGNQAALRRFVDQLASQLSLATRISPYAPQAVRQMSLF